ncbi:hypothetical protein T492DRAFT_845868 [Pavlovales sp. CCMP2436]|nr:hypothetical protein T492DRAFT_845868 [Pavlovales sp. CCMP2436]
MMGTGKWLKLGDKDSGDVKAQAGNEQVNVSLVAALMFTVTTSYLFNVDQGDWAFAEEKWRGVRGAGIWHELQLVISFTASLTTILSTLTSVVILMVSGELANNEVWRGYPACINAVSALTALLLRSHHPHLHPHCRATAARAAYVESLCNEFGVGMLTAESLMDYIAGTRDKDPSAKARDGMSSVLSPATTLLLSAIVHKTMQCYVDDQMVLKGNRVVDGIAAHHGFK